MKFTRRHDLDPHTRIEIVNRAWQGQGLYGHMSQVARDYHISRTFLYQMTWAARHQLEALFSTPRHLEHNLESELEQLMLLLRLEGKCSIPSLSSILAYRHEAPNSVGYLSRSLTAYGRLVPSTLEMTSSTSVFYLSDEIFAIGMPILVTIEPRSTAILKIQRASDRSAQTWKAHFEALGDHHFHSLGMASDRGVGLVSGYQAACPEAIWVCDQFHEFRDLFKRCHQLERQAYSAIGKEDKAAQHFAKAKSEANLHKRLAQYEQRHHACEQAMARYDHCNSLLELLRDSLHFCSPCGRLRTVEEVRSDVTCLLSMIEEIDDVKLPKLLKPIRSHIDDILVPFKQIESVHVELSKLMPSNALDALALAWHHDHLSYQSHGKKKKYHQHEKQFCLDFAQGILGGKFAVLKQLVFDKLSEIVKASSLIEMVNSLIRPYLNSSKGQLTQEALNLIMFYHNHRRYRSGKRAGKAPIELLTGETLKAHWVDLLIQYKQAACQDASGDSGPTLRLVSNHHEPALMAEIPTDQAILEPSANLGHPSAPRGAQAA
jgi:hypothetical protein